MAWRGTLGKQVAELRFVLCSKGQASAGVREWLRGSYAPLKAMNPALPLLVRESDGASARVLARFPEGKEKAVDLVNLRADEVETAVGKLVSGKL